MSIKMCNSGDPPKLRTILTRINEGCCLIFFHPIKICSGINTSICQEYPRLKMTNSFDTKIVVELLAP